MTQQPLVSVVIPVYNVEAYLPACLESILEQSYNNIEIILIDDGSTDGSGKLCDAYAEQMHVRVIHKANEGVNFARRDGYDASRGEFITFVDADDILDVNFVTNNLRLLQKTGADFSVSKTHNFYGESLTKQEIDQCRVGSASLDYTHCADKKTMLSAFMTSSPPYRNMALMCAWAKMYKRSLVAKVSWDIANYTHGEDYFICAQAFDVAESICFINEYGYYYRRNRNGKLTFDLRRNTSPEGRIIDSFAHIPVLAQMYRKMARKHRLDLDHEIVIFQCRLYTYWLDKMISKSCLTAELWSRYVVRRLLPLAETFLSEGYKMYMSEHLSYGSELYETLRDRLIPIIHSIKLEQYLQHKLRLTEEAAATEQSYVSYKNAWVIMDRPQSATDNGYHFYKWLRKHHPEINLFFVIDKMSKDVAKLKSEDFRLIYVGTEQHKQLLNESQVELYAFYTFNLCPTRTAFDSLKVYLGHGVKKDDSLNPGLSASDLFVTSFKREFDFYHANRSDFTAILTGMPRFESLVATSRTRRAKIVVAPTWRRWLIKKTGQNADYFAQWSSLLKANELKKLSSKYEIMFLLHPEMNQALDQFRLPSFIHSMRYADIGAEGLQQLMHESKLLVTDFSSIAFDYAIAGSAVAYFQFDKEAFYTSHTSQKGWYDYERDGFGPVFQRLPELVNYLADGEFEDEAKMRIYKQRLDALVRDFPKGLSSPSKNIYEQVLMHLSGNKLA